MKSFYLLPFSIVSLVLFIDQVSKYLASQFISTEINQGLFLGFGSSFFGQSLIVVLSCFTIFLGAAYLYLLKTLERKNNNVKILLSLLMGGILGNVLDRILFGHTRDFIPGINSSFNFADIMIVGSIGIMLFLIMKPNSTLLKTNELRKIIIVNKREQFRIGFYFAITSLVVSALLGVFTYTFFKYKQIVTANELNDYLLVYILISLLSTLYAFIIGLLLSHKSVGALYAFELYLNRLLDGHDANFKLRERDDFKHLENTAEIIKEKIRKAS